MGPITSKSTAVVARATVEAPEDMAVEGVVGRAALSVRARLTSWVRRLTHPGTSSDLDAWLHAHDNRPYPAYHDIEGTWSFEKFAFTLDHAQADPYAAPSKARLKIPHAHAQFPLELYSTRTRRVALADYLLRTVYDACTSKRYDQRLSSGGWSGGKGGQIEVDEPGQQVLERTAVQIDDEGIEVRFLVGLPARGRSIMGALAATVCTYLL